MLALQPVPPVEKIQKPSADPKLTREEEEAITWAVVTLFSLWDLGESQALRLLGGLPAGEWNDWKGGCIGPLSHDRKLRVAHLMAIYLNLRSLFLDKRNANLWITRKNMAFDGLSVLHVMLRDGLDGIVRVRHYLDSVIAG